MDTIVKVALAIFAFYLIYTVLVFRKVFENFLGSKVGSNIGGMFGSKVGSRADELVDLNPLYRRKKLIV